MPDNDLTKIGEEIIELAPAWPGAGLEKVGKFARDLGHLLDAAEDD
jgi:hypothetical protein